ncbi:MAG TPA: hypothetical protein PKI41_14620 [Candidatus Competibacteraceae bacterium]|nr:hypothetical protein [Candidatus Competibacteraceae bacterium]HQA26528.1 hypothetical protein [Candidatus Competibacteraceae bacterium]
MSVNINHFQALAKEYEEYRKSELLLEYVSGETSLAASKEVNYAFQHLIEALSKSTGGLNQEELEKVQAHLKRAAMDNIDAALLHQKINADKVLHSKLASDKARSIASKLSHDFTEVYSLVREDPDRASIRDATKKMIQELEQMEALKAESSALAALEKRKAVFQSYIYMASAIGIGVAVSLIHQLLSKWL